jgi:hypothetical protein
MTDPGASLSEHPDRAGGLAAGRGEPGSAGRRPLGPQSLDEMFGGRRGIVDGAVPPIVFVIANSVRHDVREAGIAAIASAVCCSASGSYNAGRHGMCSAASSGLPSPPASPPGPAAQQLLRAGIVLNAGYLAAFIVSS